MPTSAKFWDRIAKRYARQPVADEASYRKKLEITQQYLRDDMELLELGCGTGSTALAHAPHVRHIRGTDVSGKMLEIARQKARDAGVDNVSFEQSAVEALDVAEGKLDMVLALSILHLLDDKEAAIAKIYRWLAPGGLFVSSTVCLGGRLGFLRAVLPVGAFFGLVPNVAFFTARELEGAIEAVGFVLEERFQPDEKKALFLVARKPA